MKNKIALQGGGYSLIVTAVVLAILVGINVFASTVPTTLTNLDISSSQLYSITSNTKVVVNNLDRDITIYWVVQSGEEDDILKNLLGKYESLSERIDVVKKNPDVFPTFTEAYTSEDVPNNSLIVECGDRYRYISNEEIYEYELDYYSYSYYAEAFDGEGAITSAIDYVVSENLPQLYLLEGHGEHDLPYTFAEQIEKENIETVALSLLSRESVPEEADCIMIYQPTSDISETERDTLADYLEGGGKLMVIAGPIEDGTLTNLNTLLANYGVTVSDGILVEDDYDHYYYGSPYLLLPDMQSHAITDSLISGKYNVILSICNGLTIADTTAATVGPLLSTSSDAFLKLAGYDLDTYEKEDGDLDGPFDVAVSITDVSGGGLVWFSSGDFLEDDLNNASSGANGDLAMNALASLIGETESMSIRSKSLSYNYLTISESTASTLKTLMIGVIPLMYFATGVFVLMIKRRSWNEK